MEVMAAPSDDDPLEAKSTWYTSSLFHVRSTDVHVMTFQTILSNRSLAS